MRYSFIRIVLPASVILMLLAAFAYMFAYTSQIRQRDEIFELEKVLDEVYRIQLAESKLASEAYHYVVTGRDHNKQAYMEEAKAVRGHLEQLERFSLPTSVDGLLRPGEEGMAQWLTQLDSLMARAPFQDSTRSNNYLRSTSYVELRHRIFGMVKLKVLPAPATESTQILPPARSTIFLQTDSPMPVPEYC